VTEAEEPEAEVTVDEVTADEFTEAHDLPISIDG
jgi:hypothetical protein